MSNRDTLGLLLPDQQGWIKGRAKTGLRASKNFFFRQEGFTFVVFQVWGSILRNDTYWKEQHSKK